MSDANRFVFVGQIERAVDPRYTQGGKAVCDLKVTQRQRAPKSEKGYYQDTLEVTLWEQDAEKAAKLEAYAWVEVTGKLGIAKQSLWDGEARKRANVWALKAALVNVRVLDEEEIREKTVDLVPIDTSRNEAPAPRAPKGTPQGPRPETRAPEPPAYEDHDADIPF